MTQRDRILKLLRERGDRGLHSFEFYGEINIPRGAAVICALKKEGYAIESVHDAKGSNGVRYFLRPSELLPTRAPAPTREPALVSTGGASAYDPWGDFA